MTDSIVAIMKKVAENEARRLSTLELGVVTSVFPHASDSDKDNYQCSVKLKHRKQPDGSDFELRKVPVATSHIGLANIPNVGDLVVLGFLNGDINAPIILGRLYNDEDVPPKNDVGQMVLEGVETVTLTTKKGTKIEIDKDGNVIIEAKGDVTLKGGEVKINDGSKGAARQDDMVEVTIPPGSFIVAVAGSATGTPNPAPVKVQGKITSSSGSVKIGG
jgi:phage baseplate assembly protein gpV